MFGERHCTGAVLRTAMFGRKARPIIAVFGIAASTQDSHSTDLHVNTHSASMICPTQATYRRTCIYMRVKFLYIPVAACWLRLRFSQRSSVLIPPFAADDLACCVDQDLFSAIRQAWCNETLRYGSAMFEIALVCAVMGVACMPVSVFVFFELCDKNCKYGPQD